LARAGRAVAAYVARASRATFAQVAQVGCAISLSAFSNYRCVARPTLAVRLRLLYVALPAGLAFFKNRFWASFGTYLQITYKALNKTN